MKKNAILTYSSIAVAVLALIIGIVLFALNKKEESYRNIAISEINHVKTAVTRGESTYDAYEGMLLRSGDKVKVGSSEDGEGYMFLKLDDDKYVMVEPDTVLSVESVGTPNKGAINIHVEIGGITNRIDSALSPDSSYEVSTPGATMAVRGTIFRVYVFKEENEIYTDIQVFEGKVEVSLVDRDGDVLDEVILTPEGNKTGVKRTEDYVEFIYKNETILLTDLPTNVLLKILEFIEEGRIPDFFATYAEDEIRKELARRMESEEMSKLPVYTVSFYSVEGIWATQEVIEGETAVIPPFYPEDTNNWYVDENVTVKYDFSQRVMKNIRLYAR